MARRHSLLWAATLVALTVGLEALPSCNGTCTTSADCGSDSYCSITEGNCLSASGVGVCVTKPTTCATLEDEVCGCDGKTYGNSCEAAKAGNSVGSQGACAATCDGGSCVCGGVTAVACPKDFFCDFGTGTMGSSCLTAGATGTCTAIPTTCSDISSPVCGCDGVSYENACEASKAGTSVFATGGCPCQGETCGDGDFCAAPVGKCGDATAEGTCTTVPDDCTGEAESDVCGCDGKTYKSACEAAKAKVSVSAATSCDLICQGGDCPCGGASAATCQTGYFCKFALPGAMTGDNCLAANAEGTCEPIPTDCPTLSSPVCGCDGKTYDNACIAAEAGQSVGSNGACPCSADLPCSTGDYCAFDSGHCLVPNATGTCQPIPKAASCPAAHTPVCGCDNVMYDNACLAAAGTNHTSVAENATLELDGTFKCN